MEGREIPQNVVEQAEKNFEIKPLYRGVWADHLQNQQELPTGGYKVFGDKQTSNLKLDFESFGDQVEKVTVEQIKAIYEKNKEGLLAWLKQVDSNVDPYTFFVCNFVQKKVQELLAVDPTKDEPGAEREDLYKNNSTPKLSELKGKSACAEQSALAQYLLQKIGIESTYMSGIAMKDAHNYDEEPVDHSFLVIKHNESAMPEESEGTYIFDIARPKSQQNLPRVLKTDVPITYELFKDQRSLLVKSTEVLEKGTLYFGVGDPLVGGKRNIIKNEN